MSRRAFHLIILTLFLLTSIYAQPELDISFNGTGLVTSEFGQGTGYMAAAVVQTQAERGESRSRRTKGCFAQCEMGAEMRRGIVPVKSIY
jgi:hypothetical protein